MHSLVRRQVTQCDGKRPYDTWALARAARGPSDRLDIYRCPHCAHFHLGNRSKGTGRPKPPPPPIELEF